MYSRHRLFREPEHNESKQVPTRRLLPKNDKDEAALHIGCLIHVSVFLDFLLSGVRDDRDNLGKTINVCHLLMAIGLILLGRWQSYTKANYKLRPIADEIVRAKVVASKNVLSYPQNFKQLSSDSLGYSVTVYHSRSARAFQLEVQVKLGRGTLLELAKKLHEIQEPLIQCIKSHRPDYALHFDATPQFLDINSKFVPHLSRVCDYPSKFRAINLFFAPLVLTPYLAEEYSFSYCLYYILIIGSLLAESYVLNGNQIKLDLEGYKDIFQSYLMWPPTCVGQQISKQFVLFPHNKNIDAAMRYIARGVMVLEILEEDGLLTAEIIPNRLIQKINDFLSSDALKVQAENRLDRMV